MRPATALLLALALVAPACKSEDKPSGSASGKGGAKAPARPQRPLGELFTGKSPALPGPLGKIKLGMSKAQLAQIAPEFGPYDDVESEEFAGVSFSASVDSKTGTVESVSVHLPRGEGQKAIAAAWGEPLAAQHRRAPAAFWFTPEQGLRARLDDKTLADASILWFERYLPAKVLLGEGRDAFSFERAPLLGMTPDAVKQAYPGQVSESGQLLFIELPSTEVNDRTQIQASVDGGKVVGFQLWIGHGGDAKLRDEIFALFKAKWGEPKEVKEAIGTPSLQFREAPAVKVKDLADQETWFLEVTP